MVIRHSGCSCVLSEVALRLSKVWFVVICHVLAIGLLFVLKTMAFGDIGVIHYLLVVSKMGDFANTEYALKAYRAVGVPLLL